MTCFYAEITSFVFSGRSVGKPYGYCHTTLLGLLLISVFPLVRSVKIEMSVLGLVQLSEVITRL